MHTSPIEAGAAPPCTPVYRLSPAESSAGQRQISDALKGGIIEATASPYEAPVRFFKNKDGSQHMCVDYKALNKINIKHG